MTQVGPGRGYYFGRDRKYQYGSDMMLAVLRELSDLYSADNDGYPFGLGDLSLKNGDTPGTENGGKGYHTTHKWGSCVDIYIIGNEKRSNSIANPGGDPKPTLLCTDTANYNFTRTCALMDIILKVRSKYIMHEVIYEDANVRPEARLTKWLADHNRGAKTELETKYGWTPEAAHRVSGFGLMALHAIVPVIEAPPRELLRKSNIRLKAPSGHKDHIHIQLS